MDRLAPMLIPLLAAALLGQTLGTARLSFDWPEAAPFDPASLALPKDDPLPKRVARNDHDPYDCFCGAN